jgi:hypothetical protein
MNVEEARRKIELLRRLTPERGASTAEAAVATRLARELEETYGLDTEREDLRPDIPARQSLTWVYWEQLVGEFGFDLRTFGGRASVELPNEIRLIIRLDGGRWYVEGRSRQGWQQLAKGTGVEAARHYLNKQAPRRYTFLHS